KGPAAPVALEQPLSERGKRGAADEGRHAVDVTAADDELVTIDIRVEDAVDAQVLAEQSRRRVLDLERILQRAQPIVQGNQELQALVAHPWALSAHGFYVRRRGRACTASGGVPPDALEAG